MADFLVALLRKFFLTPKQDMCALPTSGEKQPTTETELPDEMIIEVMSRCSSIDALATFRSSCKSLNALAHDSKFIATLPTIFSGFLQLHSTPRFCRFIEINNSGEHRRRPDISIDFLPVNVKIKACSNTTGLLFCTSPGPYYLCKPTTKELLEISNHGVRGDYGTYALIVITLNPLHFKILRLTLHDGWSIIFGDRYVCQLYDSKIPTGWKTLKHVLRVTKGSTFTRPVTANGHINFLETNTGRLYAFDAFQEKWKIFSLPPEFTGKNKKFLMKYKGKLILVLIDGYDIIIESVLSKVDGFKTIWMKKNYQRIFLVDFKFMRMKSSSLADSDLESYGEIFWSRIDMIDLQSDFQKMGWAS